MSTLGTGHGRCGAYWCLGTRCSTRIHEPICRTGERNEGDCGQPLNRSVRDSLSDYQTEHGSCGECARPWELAHMPSPKLRDAPDRKRGYRLDASSQSKHRCSRLVQALYRLSTAGLLRASTKFGLSLHDNHRNVLRSDRTFCLLSFFLRQVFHTSRTAWIQFETACPHYSTKRGLISPP